MQLKKHKLSPEELDINILLSRLSFEVQVVNLIKTLRKFEEGTKKLQCSDANICTDRDYFDTVLQNNPILSDQLDTVARAVFKPIFAFRLLKVQEAHEKTLMSAKRQKLQRLLLKRDLTTKVALIGASIIERAAKRLLTSDGIR